MSTREDMARTTARRGIASEEARLAERFSLTGVECLRSHVERLIELARTPAEVDEAREAIDEFNRNARPLGIGEVV